MRGLLKKIINLGKENYTWQINKYFKEFLLTTKSMDKAYFIRLTDK